MREFRKDKLIIKVFETRNELGKSAADAFQKNVQLILQEKLEANIIFAAAPSQNEFLNEIINLDIPWNKINAFHMDEYVGLAEDVPQGFADFLKQHLFKKVQFKSVHYLNGNSKDIKHECKRYANLLNKYPADMVCLGIGENTHLAFNDPHVADFFDKKVVKFVELDEDCRKQQVNDGCFKTLDEVPRFAITVTIPALLKARFISAVVPGQQKAKAVYHTLHSEIMEKYPSTILRKHNNTTLYIDEQSASMS
ncbi:MAG TPA: 6-phosphogluconolactonase [Flavisolibacter sp.]|nr:6-phosphogluconolactonase [Flavisolibacter sp.]